jgi:hypothetical protein
MKPDIQVQENIKPAVYHFMAVEPLSYKSHTQAKDFILYLY